jgi:hypothetical protein
MRVFGILSICALVSANCLAPASAAPLPCSKRDDLVKLLDGKYREGLSGFGLAGQTNLVEVYVSKQGSFTILATTPQGISCIIATGQSWEKVAPAKHLTAS